jgi:hypothetical protein
VAACVYSLTPPQAPIKQALKALRHLEIGGAHLSERQREARALTLFRRAQQLFLRLVPRTVQWLDAAGATIRSFSPASRGDAAAEGFFLLLGGLEVSSSAGGGFVGISRG